MNFLLVPSTITILIPAVDRLLDYLQAKDATAAALAALTEQLNESSSELKTATDAAAQPAPPSQP